MSLNRFAVHTLLAFALMANIVHADDKQTSESKAESVQAEKPADDGFAVAINGTPKIDGELDEIWKKAKGVKVDKPVESLQVIDEDDMARATVKLLWDDKHLYALWRVVDPKLSAIADNPWEHDSVELFLDENKKATTSYESDDAQYRVNFKSELSGQGEGYDVEKIKAKTKATKKGYLVEMAIEIKHVELKAGAKLGLELQVNDNSGDGTRGAAAKWQHTEDDSWEDTSNFGTLMLK